MIIIGTPATKVSTPITASARCAKYCFVSQLTNISTRRKRVPSLNSMHAKVSKMTLEMEM